MTPGAFAAITLDAHGGGVAGASRLMWRVLSEEWGAACRLITLVESGAREGEFRSSAVARVRFGTRVAATQALGRAEWTFYSHLSLAQVQEYMPVALRRPYAIFLHGIEAWRPLTAANKRAVAGAKLLIANSTYTARRIAHAHPWVGPIAICPLALPAPSEWVAHEMTALDRQSGRPTVLVVGRMSSLERYKGHDQLLDAWSLVRASQPDARLVCVGTGDDVERLKAKARDLGHGPSVIFTGFVTPETLASHYKDASVFAMPSRDEGFGLVYLEAMAHGVPCIGSTHDAAGDVIEDGVTGFLVDQSDIAGMATRLIALLSDDELRNRLGANGRRRLQQRFTYEMFRDRLKSLLVGSFGSDLPRVLPVGAV